MMPVNRCRAGGLFCGSKAGGAGVASCFLGKLQRILFKSPPPSRRILTKVFSKTFTKLSLTFPRPSEIRRARKIPIPLHRQLRPTRPADGAKVFYSPHSAVSPPAPASWQSNRSITKGREKARRKTRKRTMRISHS